MKEIPSAVIIVGQDRESNLIRECFKLGIKTITIVDTNCDPTLTDYPIPANDDSILSLNFVINSLIDDIC